MIENNSKKINFSVNFRESARNSISHILTQNNMLAEG
jgi:hypothetical protein